MVEQRGSGAGGDDEETPAVGGNADRDADDSLPPASDVVPMDFSIFLLSLNTSALMHLGHAVQGEGPARVNLPMARQVIDIIAMLEDKTHGNLTGREEQLLHQVLFDLRVRYARTARSAPGR